MRRVAGTSYKLVSIGSARLLVLTAALLPIAPACSSATSPRDVPPDATPDPPLFATTAREQGLDSRMRLWEVDRTPNTSVLRSTPDQDLKALGHGLLLFGCAADIGRARGFEYFVILDQPLPFSRSGQGAHWDTVLGFSHVPDPDLAREFPEHYEEGRTYTVRPTDRERLFGPGKERSTEGGSEGATEAVQER